MREMDEKATRFITKTRPTEGVRRTAPIPARLSASVSPVLGWPLLSSAREKKIAVPMQQVIAAMIRKLARAADRGCRQGERRGGEQGPDHSQAHLQARQHSKSLR